MQGYVDFEKANAEAGVKLAGEALQGVETASTVAVAAGGTGSSPTAVRRTREILGGFYLPTCPIWTPRWTGRRAAPARTRRRIEVRPIQSYDF